MRGAEAVDKVGLVDNSPDGSLDDSVKEIETISQGWNFVKSFLSNLEQRNKLKMNDETDRMIIDINNEIGRYVIKNDPDLITNELSKITGTKPKTFGTNVLSKPNSALDDKPSLTNIDNDTLKILSRLDNRSLPKLDRYDENSGMNFVSYLEQFEEYYNDNFRGNRYLWITELKDHLSGRMLDIFNSVRQVDDSYDEIKRKLIAWYIDEKESREDRARIKFERAKKKDGENALMFSNSLLALFRLAYPDKNYKRSMVLINKLKSCLSFGLRGAINAQMMNYKMNDLDMSWKDVQKIIRIYELQHRDEDRSDDDTIVINFKDRAPINNNSNDIDSFKFKKPPTYEYKPYMNNANRHNVTNYRNNASYQNNYRGNSPQFNPRPQFVPRPHFTRPPFMTPRFTPPRYSPPQFTTPHFSPPPIENVQTCEYCRKIGHNISICRSRLNLCFICGLGNHHYRQCTRYQPKDNRRYSVSEQQPVSRVDSRPRRFNNSHLNQ